jgi:hypothetical protein
MMTTLVNIEDKNSKKKPDEIRLKKGTHIKTI